MNIRQIPCYVCAYEEDGKVMELRFEPVGEKSSLGNIYVGQIENIAANIGAAFVQISAGEKCYLQLSDAPNAIYASVKKGDRPLKAGDEILVQISREAMKGKLPAVTTNLNFTGKYLVLTTGDKKFGLSSKLSNDDRSRISKWMEAEVNRPDKEFGIIVRTNAADASKEEILKELEYLKGLYHKAAVDGRSRTCFSCVYRTEPFYISAVRDANSRNLEEIIISGKIPGSFRFLKILQDQVCVRCEIKILISIQNGRKIFPSSCCDEADTGSSVFYMIETIIM